MKDKAMGDYAPTRTPYQDFRRFRVVVNRQANEVWIYDLECGGIGNRYDLDKVEAAIAEFITREF